MSLQPTGFITIPGRSLRAKDFDVVVAGAGTAGAIAAVAAARQGVKTAVIEMTGYPGGTAVDGATVLHSFYNAWKSVPGAQKRQVVKGMAQQVIDRLAKIGGTSGHTELEMGSDYDAICSVFDVEMLKLVLFDMLAEANVYLGLHTVMSDVVMNGSKITGVIVENRDGRETWNAKCFVDCTGYGDLCVRAGAEYTEVNDYDVGSNIGIGNVNIENFHTFLQSNNALTEYGKGMRSGKDDMIIRLEGDIEKLPAAFKDEAKSIGMKVGTASVHDNFFMSIELNYTMPANPADPFEASKAEVELRKRQLRALELIKQHIPNCSIANIGRTALHMNPRRARTVTCDFDIPFDHIKKARHYTDNVMVYGFIGDDSETVIDKANTYGVPYSALRVKGIDNLLAAGMMVTSDRNAHNSTRTTVCCMGQGQAAGTAAGLCAKKNCNTGELAYTDLKAALVAGGVYFEEGNTAIESSTADNSLQFRISDISMSLAGRKKINLRYGGPLQALKGVTFTITLFNVMGRQIVEWKGVRMNTKTLRLTLPPVAKGYVLMKVEAGAQVVRKKLRIL